MFQCILISPLIWLKNDVIDLMKVVWELLYFHNISLREKVFIVYILGIMGALVMEKRFP